MEVTKSNFAAVLPDVKEAIAASDFLSFDLEFTGLIRLPLCRFLCKVEWN